MKKVIAITLSLLYFFTAQLTVHAFAMHGWSHWNHHNNNTQEQHHCWHINNNWSEEDKHDMSLCLKQSMWAFVENIPYITDNNVAYIYQQTYALSSTETTDQLYTFSLYDPWWWEDWNFPIYLDELYGHGIIMTC